MKQSFCCNDLNGVRVAPQIPYLTRLLLLRMPHLPLLPVIRATRHITLFASRSSMTTYSTARHFQFALCNPMPAKLCKQASKTLKRTGYFTSIPTEYVTSIVIAYSSVSNKNKSLHNAQTSKSSPATSVPDSGTSIAGYENPINGFC